MASVILEFRKSKTNGKGETPIYIRIIKNRKAKFVSTGIKLLEKYWDEKKFKVKKSHPNSARYNSFLAQKVAEAEAIVVSLETSTKYATANKMKDAILGRKPESIFKYLDRYVADLRRNNQISTANRFNATGVKLKEYVKGIDLSFEDITVALLKGFSRHLSEKYKNKTNTIHTNLKSIRKLYNDAIRDEVIDAQSNPFSKFKLTWDKTDKIYLTQEELDKIDNLVLPAGSMISIYKDMFVFACYAGGLRISDVLQLRRSNFDGSHINVIMQKTNDPVSVMLPTKAKSIIEKYSTGEKLATDFIFPIFDTRVKYSDPVILHQEISRKTALANKNLVSIATKAEIGKEISFHSSRHTWATLALKKGMRMEHVSKLMGHTELKTTQVYAKIVNSDLDKAMAIFE